MIPHYTYISSIDFINNLIFNHVETCTFQRGKDFQKNTKLNQDEYERLKRQKAKQNILSPEEEKSYKVLDRLLNQTQYLINEKGDFHPSSKRTHTFLKGDSKIAEIKYILQTEIIEIPRWLCAPIYRYALVFFDTDHKIVAALNICLTCQFIETSMFNHVNADSETYYKLRRFFIDIGYEVENSDYLDLNEKS